MLDAHTINLLERLVIAEEERNELLKDIKKQIERVADFM